MPDRVRQAMFNIMGAAWGDPGTVPPVAVLDVFAGSGALGIEALSRGAAYCCFVEEDRAAVRILKGNLKTLGLQPQAHIVQASALTVRAPIPPAGRSDTQIGGQAEGKTARQGATLAPFGAARGSKDMGAAPGKDKGAASAGYAIVFLDPPYPLSCDSSVGGPIGQLLASLPHQAKLAPSVLLVLRHEAGVGYDQHLYGRFKAFDVREYGRMALTFMEPVSP